MGGVTLAELRHGLRRFVAPAVAILLGVAFFTATLALSSTMQGTLERAAALEVQGHTAVVTGDRLGTDDLREIRSVPAVSKVSIEQSAFVTARGDGQTHDLEARTVVADRIEVASGRPTAGRDEVLLNPPAAATLGVSTGSTVTIGGSPGTSERRTVAGIVEVTGYTSFPLVIGDSQEVSRWSGQTSYAALLVAGSGSPDHVVQQLRDTLGEGVTVRTAEQETDHRVADMITGVRYITMFFGLFAVIALFVAGMVIANTFQILLAQRSQQLALLRCVGASRRQVTRAVVGESFALGTIASALGVLTGIGVVAGFVRLSDHLGMTALPMERLGVSAVAVVAPLLLGIVVTVAAALQPARRASRVTPLAALRPEPAPTARSRASRIRVGVGAVVATVGFGGLLLGALAGQAPVAVGGGILSFLGVILTAPVLVPALARHLGRLSHPWAGVPGELATDNTVRNPRRTAATSTALLVGITLMASMLVGATTSKAAIDQAVDEQFALDVSVSTRHTSIPAGTRRDIASSEGVERTAVLRTTRARVSGPKLSHEQDIAGVPDSARQVLRDPSVLDGLAPGRLVIDRSTAEDFGIENGATVEVKGVRLTARLADGDAGALLVTTSDLRRIDDRARPTSVWVRTADDADAGSVVGDIRRETAAIGAEVGGAAGSRAELDSLVRMMLLIVTALLAVAVVIAMVGVANTLGLSVLERRRETALLRALGLTARQVRHTLTWEALLVSLVASLVGTVLGVIYGWAGTLALLGKYAEGMLPQVPVGLLALLVLAAASCGLLASWAPARRAARTAPVAALAAE